MGFIQTVISLRFSFFIVTVSLSKRLKSTCSRRGCEFLRYLHPLEVKNPRGWGSNSRIPPPRRGSREVSRSQLSESVLRAGRISSPRVEAEDPKKEQVEASLNTTAGNVPGVCACCCPLLPSRNSRKGQSNPTVSACKSRTAFNCRGRCQHRTPQDATARNFVPKCDLMR